MTTRALLSFFVVLFATKLASAQGLTAAQELIYSNEDSLSKGVNTHKTVISGYGSAFYKRNFNAKQSVASLERVVLFVGHTFNSRISLFTEMEMENALVEGEEAKGEISMEQAFLKFNLRPNQYLIAGLFVPRIGIINENHLPVNFNGVERPLVEQLVIPATWRELGIGFYGSSTKIPLNYSIAIVNGLNSEGFEHGSGIREGRAEGSNAFANNLAVTGSLQYNWKDFKFQVSGYAGGTVGLSPRGADSLNLDSGAFGTALYLAEGDIQYLKNAFNVKALFTNISYPDAGKINTAYAKNVATNMLGGYLELGYDWLYHKQNKAAFITFARFEYLDLNESIPPAPKGIYDGTLKQQHLIAGISYLPIPNVVIKADVRLLHTGPQNPELVINPAPNALPYKQNNTFFNFGIGYSF